MKNVFILSVEINALMLSLGSTLTQQDDFELVKKRVVASIHGTENMEMICLSQQGLKNGFDVSFVTPDFHELSLLAENLIGKGICENTSKEYNLDYNNSMMMADYEDANDDGDYQPVLRFVMEWA